MALACGKIPTCWVNIKTTVTSKGATVTKPNFAIRVAMLAVKWYSRLRREKLTVSHFIWSNTHRLLFNPKAHHSVQKSPPPVSIIGQMNSVHNPPPYFLKISFNITLATITRSSEWSLAFRIFYQNIVRIFHLPNSCYLHRPSFPFYYPNTYFKRKLRNEERERTQPSFVQQFH